MAGERDMYAATGGVNTHKGMVFSLGLLMGAAGWLEARDEAVDVPSLVAVIRRMTGGLVERELEARKLIEPLTAGERLYRDHGFLGIRGEVQAGFPTVITHGLPVYREGLRETGDHEAAAHQALLSLLLHAEDSNLMKRGGPVLYRETKARAGRLLKLPRADLITELKAFDAWCTAHHLSPGGTADLLALTFFFHGIEEKNLQEVKPLW
jgi:triphosphoribosyl-dephospho-CoA synthase